MEEVTQWRTEHELNNFQVLAQEAWVGQGGRVTQVKYQCWLATTLPPELSGPDPQSHKQSRTYRSTAGRYHILHKHGLFVLKVKPLKGMHDQILLCEPVEEYGRPGQIRL